MKKSSKGKSLAVIPDPVLKRQKDPPPQPSMGDSVRWYNDAINRGMQEAQARADMARRALQYHSPLDDLRIRRDQAVARAGQCMDAARQANDEVARLNAAIDQLLMLRRT